MRSKKQGRQWYNLAISKNKNSELNTYFITLYQILKLKGQKGNHQEGHLSSVHISQDTATLLNLKIIHLYKVPKKLSAVYNQHIWYAPVHKMANPSSYIYLFFCLSESTIPSQAWWDRLVTSATLKANAGRCNAQASFSNSMSLRPACASQ